MEELFLFHKAVLQNLMEPVTHYGKQAAMGPPIFKGLPFFPRLKRNS